MMRKERLKSRQEEYKKQRKEQFQFKNLELITEILTEEFGGPMSSTSSEVSPVSPVKTRSSDCTPVSSKKRKWFAGADMDSDENMFPSSMAHVRDSERKVKDSLYLTISALSGHGMSLAESCYAVLEVANNMFDRQWKLPDCDSDTFDLDTLPDVRNIRSKLQLIEVETLSFAVSKISTANESGSAITAAIDSTTKRGVGQFATQGIHIGRNDPVPLPLMGISGESTQDVA